MSGQQPEVFETPDVTYDEEGPIGQSQTPEAEADPALDVTEPNKADAYNKFKGTVLDASEADFNSDKNTGYRTLQVAEHGALDESVQERFHRLQIEVTDFLQQVQRMKDAQDGQSLVDDSGPSLATMASQVQSLNEQLQQVKLDEILGARSAPLDRAPAHDKEVATRLVAEVEKIKGTSTQAPEAAKQGGGEITYTLHYTPEQAKYQQLSRVAELEQRVAQLEHLVGSQSITTIGAFLGLKEPTLKAAVDALTQRVYGISPQSLDNLNLRLASLSKKLDEVAAKSKDLALKADEKQKIEELYALTQQWSGVSGALPAIVGRLRDLQSLHEQAADFSATLTHMDQVQTNIKDQLAMQGVTLSTLEKSLKENTTTIRDNMASLEQRLAALS
ncbi:hypothetical protein PTSG_11640 [Salpingoeca rosetta]|uniref:Dynactin subunit 2 n=1 Tax=Salpingoeca rosetta (strain ATCC 50818 / BSB-021) TaxID=946362 RepID=F2TXE5_SALR5|nr:uncharacterized protein PTSG_11640 [Salpingoeca rosetta]EGD76054.1 hypothetical protein PTSG_11640 [Salpingoeca rosetta]|eukprot:XP_004998229.1 hypothetical protein PTSG_11640 [Salpingoeca rosetta]